MGGRRGKVDQQTFDTQWKLNPGDEFVQSKSGLQKLAYNMLMDSHYNLDFEKHMIERISTLFQPFAAIIQWHLSYEGSKLHNELEELSQDPLILCLEPPVVLPAHVQTEAPSSVT